MDGGQQTLKYTVSVLRLQSHLIMDVHNRTLGTFSIYHLFGDVQNAVHGTKLDHACERLEMPYQFWHEVQLYLHQARHYAFAQNVQGFLQPTHHVVVSFCLDRQNYRGLNEFLQGFANLRMHRLVQSVAQPMYTAGQNSLMHSVVRHSNQNLTILRRWQYHLRILALLHQD